MTQELSTNQSSALSEGNMQHSLAIAQQLAKSDLLPPHFRGKPENILLVLSLAKDFNISNAAALQTISVVSGKPCLQSSLLIALLSQKGCLKGPLRFRYEGQEGKPEFRCQAYGIDRETGETVEGLWVSMAHAQAEGWTRNPKYKSLPSLMLQYRAAAFFIRGLYPQVALGLHTSEEVTDMEYAEREVGPSPAERIKAAREKNLEAQPEAIAPEVLPPDTGGQQLDDELTDILTQVSDCTEGPELVAIMEAASDFSEVKKTVIWNAIKSKASDLGLEYSKSGNNFITKE